MRTWVFADFAVPSEDDIKMLADCGVSDVVLGVATSKGNWKLNYSREKWLEAAKLCSQHFMKHHYMFWGVPNPNHMTMALETLTSMGSVSGATSIMIDAEGTWHKGNTADRDATIDVLSEYDGYFGVTGLDRMHKTVKPLAEKVDYLLPQAYSFWKPGGAEHWSHSTHTFPAYQQRRAYESWGVPFPSKPYVMGLACYWGKRPKSGVFPGITDIQSMRFAMTETIAIWHEAANGSEHPEGWFHGVAYWSLKHLRGDTAERQARREFLTMLQEA